AAKAWRVRRVIIPKLCVERLETSTPSYAHREVPDSHRRRNRPEYAESPRAMRVRSRQFGMREPPAHGDNRATHIARDPCTVASPGTAPSGDAASDVPARLSTPTPEPPSLDHPLCR